MAHSRGTRSIVRDLPHLDKVRRRVRDGEVILTKLSGHDGIRATAGAGRRDLERCAGDGARGRVQVPAGHVARGCGRTAGRGVEVLGRGRVPARYDDLVGHVVRGVGKALKKKNLSVSPGRPNSVIYIRGRKLTIGNDRVRNIGVGEQASRGVSAQHADLARTLQDNIHPFLVGVHHQVPGLRGSRCRDELHLSGVVRLGIVGMHPDTVLAEVRRIHKVVLGVQICAVNTRGGAVLRLRDNALQRARLVDRHAHAGAVGAPGHAPDGVGCNSRGADEAGEGVDALGWKGHIALVRQVQVIGNGVALKAVRG